MGPPGNLFQSKWLQAVESVRVGVPRRCVQSAGHLERSGEAGEVFCGDYLLTALLPTRPRTPPNQLTDLLRDFPKTGFRGSKAHKPNGWVYR